MSRTAPKEHQPAAAILTAIAAERRLFPGIGFIPYVFGKAEEIRAIEKISLTKIAPLIMLVGSIRNSCQALRTVVFNKVSQPAKWMNSGRMQISRA